MKHKIELILMAAALVCLAGCKSAQNATMDKDFLQLAAERYSVRSFDSTPVGQDLIDKIIEAGKLAPTAINAQPQKIYVVKSEEGMAALNEASPCMYGAPHCFVVCYDSTVAARRGEYGSYGDIDATIVLTHMALEAADLGLGTCIVGYFDEGKVKTALDLPSNIHPVLLLPFGKESAEAAPSDRHNSFRPLEETVEYR